MKDTLWLHQHAAWLKLYLWYETINWGGDLYSPWMMVTLGSINFQQNSITNPFPSQGSQNDTCLSCALLEQLHPTWWLWQKQRTQLSCRVSSYHHLPSFPFEGTNRINFLLPSSHQREDWSLQDEMGHTNSLKTIGGDEQVCCSCKEMATSWNLCVYTGTLDELSLFPFLLISLTILYSSCWRPIT